MQNELEHLFDNYNEYVEEEETLDDSTAILSTSEVSSNLGYKEMTLSHFTLIIPKIEVSFVSRKQGTYSKYFMLILVQDTFLQTITGQRDSQILYYIKNFEIIDKLMNMQKFSKALQMKDPVV